MCKPTVAKIEKTPFSGRYSVRPCEASGLEKGRYYPQIERRITPVSRNSKRRAYLNGTGSKTGNRAIFRYQIWHRSFWVPFLRKSSHKPWCMSCANRLLRACAVEVSVIFLGMTTTKISKGMTCQKGRGWRCGGSFKRISKNGETLYNYSCMTTHEGRAVLQRRRRRDLGGVSTWH